MRVKNSAMDAEAFAQKHARILGLWRSGATSGDIAALVKLSRNSVMGVLHRARKRGLIELRKTEVADKKTKPSPKRVRVKRLFLPSIFDKAPIPEPEPVPVFVEPVMEDEQTEHEPVHILDARFGQCRWIVGRAPDNLVNFCGRPTKGGLSYCVAHHKMVYVPFSKVKTSNSPKKAYR